MKARLILDENHSLALLYADGTIASVDSAVLFNFFMRFKRTDNYFSNGKKGIWRTDSYPEMSSYPGTTVAVLADNDKLVIHDPTPFMSLVQNKEYEVEYISTSDFAKLHDKSIEIVKVFCRNGRIPGVKKVGNTWLIPADANYPVSEEHQRYGARGPRPHTRKKKQN